MRHRQDKAAYIFKPNSLGDMSMNLSAPTLPVFLLSFVLAVLAALVAYAGVKIPLISGHAFITLGIAYLLLLAGNLFKGI